jgi:hypothetical protein
MDHGLHVRQVGIKAQPPLQVMHNACAACIHLSEIYVQVMTIVCVCVYGYDCVQ